MKIRGGLSWDLELLLLVVLAIGAGLLFGALLEKPRPVRTPRPVTTSELLPIERALARVGS